MENPTTGKISGNQMMMVNALGTDTLAVIDDLHRRGVKKYVVLMRHAERPIDKPENDLLMMLTDEGQQAAYEFGRALPSDSLIRFFSSPVDRCVETSNLIEKGLLATGGESRSNEELDALYFFYVRDIKVDHILYDMFEKGEWAQFFRNWFEGEYTPEFMDEGDQAARTLVEALLGLLQDSPEGGNICISHDNSLFLIKEYYLGLRPEDYEYIQFLEGVILYEWDGAYYIANHQTAAKRLPFPF
jgi:broad specificity phosphatase PhoE